MSEIVKIKDLPFGVSGIYKINYPNGKVYIGQSNDIRRRVYEHKTGSKRVHAQLCDLKIQEFGMELDEIEILERVNIADLDIMEETKNGLIYMMLKIQKKDIILHAVVSMGNLNLCLQTNKF